MISQLAVFTRRVRECIRPAAVTVSAGESCEEVVRALRERGATLAVVVDAHGQLAGIVTEQDVVRRVAFAVDGQTPVERVMSAPVETVGVDAPLYEAIGRMRKLELRHMPAVDETGSMAGVLQLDDSLTTAAAQMMQRIDRLTRGEGVAGARRTKAAQVELAADLLSDAVPAVEVQSLLSRINIELHRRVIRLSIDAVHAEGLGPAPVGFDVLLLGSGGRGESLLHPDQDNAFILGDDAGEDGAEVDRWFAALARRMTRDLDDVGFPYCPGDVMATNPSWRKRARDWRVEVDKWIGQSEGKALRMCDIFFDFTPVLASGTLARDLRRQIATSAPRAHFLRELFKIDEAHGVALGLFGRLQRDSVPGPHRGKVNLKLTGTLPLVGAVRILALREGIEATATRERMKRLAERGRLGPEELDRLEVAFGLIVRLNLREQLRDLERGVEPGNHVAVAALSKRERSNLVAAFRAIRSFRARVRNELTGDLF